MTLELIGKGHYLYNKVLAAENLQETLVDTILENQKHERFLSIPTDERFDRRDYEKQAFKLVTKTAKKLEVLRQSNTKVHGLGFLFGYDEHNQDFERRYLHKMYDPYDWRDSLGATGDELNMFENLDLFVEHMVKVAASERHHDGAILVDAHGNYRASCLLFDCRHNAVKEAYLPGMETQDEQCILEKAGFERYAGRARLYAAVSMSHLVLDAPIALTRGENFDVFVLKNGLILWPDERRKHPEHDYGYHMGRALQSNIAQLG